jgi:large subunit ribosomal protein L11
MIIYGRFLLWKILINRLDHNETFNRGGVIVAKKITRIAKLEFMAMQAKPGAELASLGINMPQFTQQFNDATKDRAGEVENYSRSIFTKKSSGHPKRST